MVEDIQIRLVTPFIAYDVKTKLPIQVVSAEDYASLVQAALRFKALARVTGTAESWRQIEKVLADAMKRIHECEASLYIASEGKAAYFDKYPDGLPPDLVGKTS